MDKKNPIYQKDYPEWKRILWGMLRAFVSTFIPVFGFMLSSVTLETLQDKDVLIKFVVTLVLSSLSAGLVGIGKYLRDLYPESELPQRLPI